MSCGLFSLSTIFVFEYGKFYDWFDSLPICLGNLIAILSLGLSIHRMIVRSIRTSNWPPSSTGTLRRRFFLFLMQRPVAPTVLQNIFTGSILQYDVLNVVSLNWWNLAGTVIGCAFAYYWHARLRKGYKVPVFLGFALIVGYQCVMYFLIDPRMNIEWLYLPTMLRGAGYIILYISLTVYVTGNVSFQHFFQVLSILGFVRTGFGSVLGGAIYSRVLQHIIPENFQTLSIELDEVNTPSKQPDFPPDFTEKP